MDRLQARRRAAGRIAGGVLLLALWLGALGAASSERLHAWLHEDAHQTAHECLFTQLAGGQVQVAAGDCRPAVLPLPVTILVALAIPGVLLPESDLRLLPSRGPPVTSLPLW